MILSSTRITAGVLHFVAGTGHGEWCRAAMSAPRCLPPAWGVPWPALGVGRGHSGSSGTLGPGASFSLCHFLGHAGELMSDCSTAHQQHRAQEC